MKPKTTNRHALAIVAATLVSFVVVGICLFGNKKSKR
jgi:hypothetical protein